MDQWKDKLAGILPESLEQEISEFESQMEMMRRGEIDPRIFGETRLRRGIYGQRYDNGQRDDGNRIREIVFPSGELMKGPDTVWDAPGMLRIKNPFGAVTVDQMIVMSDLAEEYADGVLHVTTRQDIQYHYVHIEDMPPVMRRLGAVGITTKEACGNVVRNVTACPLAGVCNDEAFDVTPYSAALTNFLLGHPDCQDFGRKFKIAFSGCYDHACGLVNMHDLGALAITKKVDGKIKRGFKLFVGGGLGAVPHPAKIFDEFVPEEELLPLSQAMGRVFARLGEKKNRAKARVKFLIAKLGIDEFKRLVLEERKILPHDDRWTSYLEHGPVYGEKAIKSPSDIKTSSDEPNFDHWLSTNIYSQRQKGYSVVTIALPLGDLSSHQGRKLAYIADKYVGDAIRLTVEQNIVLRWVSNKDLPELYKELNVIGLATPDAGTIVDVTSCPGTDTCKLGIASSRGLAGELRLQLAQKSLELDKAIKGLRIKVSGCFNSCGQHHIADIGFYGNSRNIKGFKVPHFQVVLGGEWKNNGGSYGMAIGAVPSKRIPKSVTLITESFIKERLNFDESFQGYVGRVGKKYMRSIIEGLMIVPSYEEDSSYYSDWGDPREFSLGDMGVGECAGEIVTREEFELQTAEREVFEAQLALEEKNFRDANDKSYHAMLNAARALIRIENYDVPNSPEIIVQEFKVRFFDTKRFFDKYAKGKFGRYLLQRFDEDEPKDIEDVARRYVEESQLFIEAAHSCYARISRGEV
ncbi:MAG: nitrite/sulfite reductase [Candidatus Marinimicrobia bacterium]|nr:nitrite/sulfite reductase [Candidatus Neomarinimicrobiota bacterium]MBT7378153.1 nitrite/sulfite reductase [Candidatus Neomarinimicrobiota bacterium]